MRQIADALYTAADHLPVFLELQLPAKIDAVTTLDFGDYIEGTVAEEMLNVANVPASPAEDLSYSMSVGGPSFTAPGGSFTAGAGADNDHTISMDTGGSAGDRYENLQIASNDLDDPDW